MAGRGRLGEFYHLATAGKQPHFCHFWEKKKTQKKSKEERKEIALKERGKLGMSQFIRNLFIFSVLIRRDGS